MSRYNGFPEGITSATVDPSGEIIGFRCSKGDGANRKEIPCGPSLIDRILAFFDGHGVQQPDGSVISPFICTNRQRNKSFIPSALNPYPCEPDASYKPNFPKAPHGYKDGRCSIASYYPGDSGKHDHDLCLRVSAANGNETPNPVPTPTPTPGTKPPKPPKPVKPPKAPKPTPMAKAKPTPAKQYTTNDIAKLIQDEALQLSQNHQADNYNAGNTDTKLSAILATAGGASQPADTGFTFGANLDTGLLVVAGILLFLHFRKG